MEKNGGDASYLNNFVDNVLSNTSTGGAKKTRSKKRGGFDLSPFLVSLLNIGAAMAVDPKSRRRSRSPGRRSRSPGRRPRSPGRRPRSGGNFLTNMLNTSVAGGDQKTSCSNYSTGGNADVSGALFDMHGSDKLIHTGGKSRRSRRKTGGTAEITEAFNALGQDPMTTGGKSRRSRRKAGGAAEITEAFNPLGQDPMTTGGAKRRGKKRNNGGGWLSDIFSTTPKPSHETPQETTEVIHEPPTDGGGKRRRGRSKAMNAFRGGGGGNADVPIYKNDDASMGMNEAANELEPFSLFGGAKRRGKQRGGEYKLRTSRGDTISIKCTADLEEYPQPGIPQQYNSDMGQGMQQGMQQGMPAMQPMPQQAPPTTGGKRRYKKRGGMDVIPDMQSPKLGGSRRRRYRGGNMQQEAQHLLPLNHI
jgi:hypothetical protein